MEQDSRLPQSPPQEDGEVLFAALLRPNLSLGPCGFRTLMGAAAVVALASGLAFLALGAWPVTALMGLEYLLLLLAFRVSFRRARLREHLRLTRRDLLVRRIDGRGEERRWRFQPYWLRVELPAAAQGDGPLLLTSHGRSLAIGDFLAPGERVELAEALTGALARLRGRAAPVAGG